MTGYGGVTCEERKYNWASAQRKKQRQQIKVPCALARVPTDICSFIGCEEPADIIFALDASGSIGRQNFETMVDFVRNVIQGMRMGNEDSTSVSRVGLLTFSDDVYREFNLNEYDEKYDILNAFPPYYRGGATNTAEALR